MRDGYDRRIKLIDLIEKPLWTITGKRAKDTLIPDLVSICKVNGQYQFIIFDAKYYNAHLKKGIAADRTARHRIYYQTVSLPIGISTVY